MASAGRVDLAVDAKRYRLTAAVLVVAFAVSAVLMIGLTLAVTR